MRVCNRTEEKIVPTHACANPTPDPPFPTRLSVQSHLPFQFPFQSRRTVCPRFAGTHELPAIPKLSKAGLLFITACLVVLVLVGPWAASPAMALTCPLDSCNTACTTTDWQTSDERWYEGQLPIVYYINKDGASNCTGDEFAAVQRAAANWERVTGSYWATCYADTTSRHSKAKDPSPARDTANVVSWEDMGGGSPLPIGYAYYWYSATGDSILEADITLNNNAAVQWSALKADSCISGKYDVENTATHEFGHWMYFYHSCDMSATMYCWGDSNETKKRSPSDCDIIAMQAQYPQSAGTPRPQPGCWPVDIGANVQSNPVLGDIDRDGIEEIVVAGDDGRVHVLTGRGKELYGWPKQAGNCIDGSPALGDVNNDGWLEIAVGSYSDSVYVFDHNGSLLTGWPKATKWDVRSTPAIADLDKDGKPDIVCASTDSCVYAWKNDGTLIPGWPVKLGGNMQLAGPAVADLNGDDSLDVVISGYDYKVYALKPHGASLTGWPVSSGRKVYDRVAVGDIDADNQYEVVATSVHDSVYAWNRDGSRCSGWPVYVPVWVDFSAPSLGDIDGDNSPEIVFGSDGDSLYAYNGNGSRVTGWPKYVDGYVRGSAVIAEIDADNAYETVAVTDNGKMYAFNGDGSNVGGWPKTYPGSAYYRSPAIGETNGDNELDMVVGSTYPGKLYAFSLGTVPGNKTYEWRMYGHDWNRTSRYGYAPAAPTPILFTDLFADLNHWERFGHGAASIGLSSISYSPPYSMGVSGSPTPGDFASAYSEFITIDFSRPYSIKFYFTYDNFFAANWIVFGHARFRLQSPTAPVFMDRAGDWSNLIPIGPPFNSYCPAGAFTEFEIDVDPSARIVMLLVNGAPIGTGQYDSTVAPSSRIWFEDKEDPGYFLTGWYDDFEVRGYLPVVGVQPKASPTPPLVNVLYQSFPNPMNPTATIQYSLKESGRVTIRIYDVAGRVIKELVNGQIQASPTPYSVVWNGTDDAGRHVASGIYFCRMEAKDFISAKKIVVLR
jgi:hypothetical protein